MFFLRPESIDAKNKLNPKEQRIMHALALMFTSFSLNSRLNAFGIMMLAVMVCTFCVKSSFLCVVPIER